MPNYTNDPVPNQNTASLGNTRSSAALDLPVQLAEKGYIIHGGFTCRNLNLPENGNTALHVCQNEKDVMKSRRQLEQDLLPLEQWVLPWQKHTDHIQRVTEKDAGKGAFDKFTSILDTDGLYTTEPDLLIGVFTADCLGILIADPVHGLIGAVHSGWKGTVQNILYKTLREIFDQKLADPITTQIFFSPSIQQKSFQIREDVRSLLLESGQSLGLDYSDLIIPDPSVSKEYRWLADHQAMNVRAAQLTGIPLENIHESRKDTMTDPACFSYRRDGKTTGEHLSFIWMEKKN